MPKTVNKREVQPSLDRLGHPTGMTMWDVIIRLLTNVWVRISLLVVLIACVAGIVTGRIDFEMGREGLRIAAGHNIRASELRRFEGQWQWSGRNLMPEKPYEYEGTLNLTAKGGHLEGEGQYRIVRGLPSEPPPRIIRVQAVPDGEYLEVRYEVQAVGVPGSRGFGFMLLFAKPNGLQMDGHFLTRSLLEDGFVWGMVSFRK